MAVVPNRKNNTNGNILNLGFIFLYFM